jgi:hypothetical protein
MTKTGMREKWRAWHSTYACAGGAAAGGIEEARATLRELEKAVALTPDRRQAGATASVNPPQRTAADVLSTAVGHLTKEGYSEAEAAREVFHTDPALQRRLIAEANQDRPPQGTHNREDLRQKAMALATPVFGRPVD